MRYVYVFYDSNVMANVKVDNRQTHKETYKGQTQYASVLSIRDIKMRQTMLHVKEI